MKTEQPKAASNATSECLARSSAECEDHFEAAKCAGGEHRPCYATPQVTGATVGEARTLPLLLVILVRPFTAYLTVKVNLKADTFFPPVLNDYTLTQKLTPCKS